MFHITNTTLFADDAEMFVKSVYTVTLFFDAPLSHHEYQITSLLSLLLSAYLSNFKYLVKISAPYTLLVSLVYFGSAANHLN